MSIRAVLFDLDGTVLDTIDDLAASTNAVLSKHGFPTHDIAAIRSFVGEGIAKLIERALPSDTSCDVHATVLEDFKQYYALHSADSTKPYEGVIKMLHALKRAGLRLALVSNKADFAVQRLATHYFGTLFDVVLGERNGIPRKPAPDMVHNALRALDVSCEEAVFVGDSDTDVLTARNAGVNGVFVTWGFRDIPCLQAAGASLLASTPTELQKLILAL